MKCTLQFEVASVFQTQYVREKSTKATGNCSIPVPRHCQSSTQGLNSSKVPKYFRLKTHKPTCPVRIWERTVTHCSSLMTEGGHHTTLQHPTVFYSWEFYTSRSKFKICCDFAFKRLCCARKASSAELQAPIFRSTAQIPALQNLQR